jgi:signal transduction histidine kinase
MKNKNRNKRLLILMLLSQILLTGFVVQWLFSQYRQEKARLRDELSQVYLESHDQMVDTLLFKSVVSPVLSHSDLVPGKNLPGNRNIKQPTTAYAIGVKEDSGKVHRPGKAIITVRMENIRDTLPGSGNLEQAKTNTRDFLLKSVKLFIRNAGDSSGKFTDLVESNPLFIDTSIFKVNYISHLPALKKKFHITWGYDKNNENAGDQNGIILIKPLPASDLPALEITGYTGYLLKAVFPQILFGLVLVIITGISFLIAYRNIRNQAILNDIRNEFISNMTHELKTPVATMKIALESLLNFNMKKDPAVTEEYLNIVSAETGRLENLINRVLEHTFLEGNKHPFSFHRFNAVTMTETVVKIMALKLGPNGFIRFNPGETDISLTGDELYIQGVLMNLIDNSIKYCDKDPEILVGVIAKESHVEISVTDNGPGIPEEYRNKIFDKFFRIPTGDVHNIKGYGLGLSYAALVMRIHGGDITCKNLHPGCSFILKFPS